MLTGQPLGAALADAIEKKGVRNADVARHFGIKGPSIYDWLKHGRIGKQHIPGLIAYFADVVEPSHWGIEDGSALAMTPTSPPATAGSYRVVQMDAEAGMGGELVNDDNPEIIHLVDFDRAYIRALMGFVPAPGRLKLVTGRGDSMMPAIQPGDVVLVDTGCEAFDGDGIYLVNSGHGHQIKRLHDRGGVIHVVSDNAVYGPPEPANDRTIIGGKVYLRNRLDRLG